MREAIEGVAKLALAFWETGAVGESLCSGLWRVEPVIWERHFGGSSGLEIRITGPTPDGRLVRWKMYVSPTDLRPPSRSEREADWKMPAAQRRRLILAWQGWLYYQPIRDHEAWVLGLVAIFFLQREWQIPDDAKTWIWDQCLKPRFKRIRSGQENVRVEFTDFLSFVPNCQAGSAVELRAYLYGVVRNLYRKESRDPATEDLVINAHRKVTDEKMRRAASYKEPDVDSQGEDTGEPISGEMEVRRKREQFNAFKRQRKHRGRWGVPNLPKSPMSDQELLNHLDTVPSLGEEWHRKQTRVNIVASIAHRMVELGAKETSAKRQVRRWLPLGGSIEEAAEQFKKWAEHRQAAKGTRKI